MSLKDTVIPSQDVIFSGGSFAVRGLSLTDITTLVAFHRERLTSLFQQYASAGDGGFQIEADVGVDFAMSVLTHVPTIGAHIIALGEVRAADEPPNFAVAITLPVDVQVDALEKVILQTFAMAGGAKKVLEIVKRAVKAAMMHVADQRP